MYPKTATSDDSLWWAIEEIDTTQFGFWREREIERESNSLIWYGLRIVFEWSRVTHLSYLMIVHINHFPSKAWWYRYTIIYFIITFQVKEHTRSSYHLFFFIVKIMILIHFGGLWLVICMLKSWPFTGDNEQTSYRTYLISSTHTIGLKRLV